MSKKLDSKKKEINLKPIHPLAPFTPVRKRLDLLKQFPICFADLCPPGIKLTGNEFKVLFVLHGIMVDKRAAIDQEKIAEILSIRQPHVAHAIGGLRKKGVIKKIWMEAGQAAYRSIYELWGPPELSERKSETVHADRSKKKAVSAKQVKQATMSFDQNCRKCYGTGWESVSGNEVRRCDCKKQVNNKSVRDK